MQHATTDKDAENDSREASDDTSSPHAGQTGNGGEHNGMTTFSEVSSAVASDWQALCDRAAVGADDTGGTKTAESEASLTAAPSSSSAAQKSDKSCCVCGAANAMYTCPACSRRTCSMTCVRCHKESFSCGGVRRVDAPVALSDFTDAQLQRDFRFLEECRRAADSAARNLPLREPQPHGRLEPRLKALCAALRRRGVLCQILSKGMRRRQINATRYDRHKDTVTWRCEFVFHHRDGGTLTVGTNWANERHRLADVVRYAWAHQPLLPTFDIDCSYNTAGLPEGEATSGAGADDGAVEGSQGEGDEGRPISAEKTDAEKQVSPQMDAPPPPLPDGASGEAADEPSAAPLAADAAQSTDESAPVIPAVVATARSAAEQTLCNAINAFLDVEDYCIFARAERLGNKIRYFRLDPQKTLNDNLRQVFFVSEFPVLDVVHSSDAERFPLVTDEDRAAIRMSFRNPEAQAQKREKKQHPGGDRAKHVIPCRKHLAGGCDLSAEECPFRHCDPSEVPLCHQFARYGSCRNPRCTFRHEQSGDPQQQQRQWRQGNDKGGGRRFGQKRPRQ